MCEKPQKLKNHSLASEFLRFLAHPIEIASKTVNGDFYALI